MKAHHLFEEQIRGCAYQIYRQRGGEPGHEIDDWLQAEYELLHLPVQQIAKLPPPRVAPAASEAQSLTDVVRGALSLAQIPRSPNGGRIKEGFSNETSFSRRGGQ